MVCVSFLQFEIKKRGTTSQQLGWMFCFVFKENNNYWQQHTNSGMFLHCWSECKTVQTLWKTVWGILKLRVEWTWSVNSTSRCMPNRTESMDPNGDLHASVLQCYSQGTSPRVHPQVNGWTEGRCTHAVEYYSALKRKLWCYNIGEPWKHYTELNNTQKGDYLTALGIWGT